MEQKHVFRLSLKEFEYLKQLASNNELLANMLVLHKVVDVNRLTMELSFTEFLQLRNYLMQQTSEVGFDENYELNERGQILEDLIDRIFIEIIQKK